MEIKIRQRLLTTAQIKQAIYEQIGDLEDRFALDYSLGATLFMNPADEVGEPVLLRCTSGKVIRKLYSDGPYECAADSLLRIVGRTS